MAVTVYKKTALTGGAAGSLDAIDGAGLLDSDFAFVTVAGVLYVYILDDDDGGVESSPSRIAPDANAGNKRWILQGAYDASVVAADLVTHAALTSPHSAASAATASRLVVRDASGRAKFAAPSAADDAAIKSTVTDHADLTTAHGAVSAATASTMVVRDVSGRAAFASPAASGDAATKGYVDGAIAGLSDFKNLKITTTGAANNQSVLLTADKVIAVTTADLPKLLSAVSVAINLGSAGANGLDTGSLAANTGYFLWVISNGTTTAGLASLSASSPTMPAGYTYKALLGWCTTDATATPFNIEEFTQIDDVYKWGTPVKISAALDTTNTTTIDLSKSGGVSTFDAVPAGIVKFLQGKTYLSDSHWYGGPDQFANNQPTDGTDAAHLHYYFWGAAHAHVSWILPIITSQTMYHQCKALGVWATGFTLKR